MVCPPGLPAEAPAPVLTSQADFDATLAYNRRLWADCRALTGPVFDHADTGSVNCDRAIARGLCFRPLAATVRDTLDWCRTQGQSLKAMPGAGITAGRCRPNRSVAMTPASVIPYMLPRRTP